MKRIEEILKSKLGGTKAEANPSMDDALWNKVESGLKRIAACRRRGRSCDWADLGCFWRGDAFRRRSGRGLDVG